MTNWKCQECGYTLEADAPPEICPSCNKKCLFKDVTCYILSQGRGSTTLRSVEDTSEPCGGATRCRGSPCDNARSIACDTA